MGLQYMGMYSIVQGLLAKRFLDNPIYSVAVHIYRPLPYR